MSAPILNQYRCIRTHVFPAFEGAIVVDGAARSDASSGPVLAVLIGVGGRLLLPELFERDLFGRRRLRIFEDARRRPLMALDDADVGGVAVDDGRGLIIFWQCALFAFDGHSVAAAAWWLSGRGQRSVPLVGPRVRVHLVRVAHAHYATDDSLASMPSSAGLPPKRATSAKAWSPKRPMTSRVYANEAVLVAMNSTAYALVEWSVGRCRRMSTGLISQTWRGRVNWRRTDKQQVGRVGPDGVDEREGELSLGQVFGEALVGRILSELLRQAYSRARSRTRT
jgi:hypothetical protein